MLEICRFVHGCSTTLDHSHDGASNWADLRGLNEAAKSFRVSASICLAWALPTTQILGHQFTHYHRFSEQLCRHHPLTQGGREMHRPFDDSTCMIFGHAGGACPRRGGGARFLDIDETELAVFRFPAPHAQEQR
jgi:hypothetical protein